VAAASPWLAFVVDLPLFIPTLHYHLQYLVHLNPQAVLQGWFTVGQLLLLASITASAASSAVVAGPKELAIALR
jgi:hypothetical protein